MWLRSHHEVRSGTCFWDWRVEGSMVECLFGTNNSLGIWHTHIYPDVSWFIIIYPLHRWMMLGCWQVGEVFLACLTLFNFTKIENWKLHQVWETNDLAMWYDIPRYQKTGDIRDASKQTWPFHLDTGLFRNRISPKSNGLKPHCPLLFWEVHLFRKRYHQNGSERLFCPHVCSNTPELQFEWGNWWKSPWNLGVPDLNPWRQERHLMPRSWVCSFQLLSS